jgi:hypothetical protein
MNRARGNFFARSGFTQKEHRPPALPDFLYKSQNMTSAWRLTHDVPSGFEGF